MNKAIIYPHIFIIIFLSEAIFNNLFSQNNQFDSYSEKILGTKQSIKMIPIAGGVFTMGSSKNEKKRKRDEGPITDVFVDGFWISEIEVTWDVYELFLNRVADKEHVKKAELNLNIDAISGATAPYVNYNKKGYPVVNVTQYAASQFCKWLSAKTGNFYRLPTEAEWEFACRAGNDEPYSFGKNARKMNEYGWFKKNSNGQIQKVRLKKPNAFGIYDMHGNVAEWVLDSYNPETYILWGNSVKNPVMIGKKLYPRVVRGGSFKSNIDELRSAARGFSKEKWKRRDPQIPKSLWWFTDANNIGFRIVRPKKTPNKDDINKMWVNPIKEY